MLRCTARTFFCLLLSINGALAANLDIPLSPVSNTNMLDIRMESLAGRVNDEGFPAIMAGSQVVNTVWVEDIDLDGKCSGEDNLVILLPKPMPDKITLVFDQIARKAPLVGAREIHDAKHIEKTPIYTATVADCGGVLTSLKDSAGRELLFLPIRYRLYAGGFDLLTTGVEAFLPQDGAPAKMFLIETPARKVLVCRYNLDNTCCMTGMGPLTAGLRGRTVYKFLPDRLGVENHLFETGRNNFPYSIRYDLHFPTAVFASCDVQNHKVSNHAVPTFQIRSKGPQTSLGVVLESPNWQFAYVTDGRIPKWGDFFAVMSFLNGLRSSMWLMPGKISPADVSPPLVKSDILRRPPTDLTTLRETIDSAGQAVDGLTKSALWTTPARVQLESAKGFFALADKCDKAYRPIQSQRLARESLLYAQRSLDLVEQAQREKWIDPGLRNDTGQSAFVRGVYWPWFGCPERKEQRAEYARNIGIDCIHCMDIQAWPEVEEKLTPQAVDAADFKPTIDFLDMLQRQRLKGLLLTMDPFWPRWTREVPVLGNPQDYDVPPEKLFTLARWVERYVKQVKDHPALCGYVIHNEPVGVGIDPKRPETKPAFIKWLKVRHQTLDALNRNWRTSYKTWNDISLPDLAKAAVAVPGAVVGQTSDAKAKLANRAAAYDFVTFQQQCFTDHLAYLTQAAVKVDPNRPVLHKLVDANCVLSYAAEPWAARKTQHKAYATNYYYGLQAGDIGHGVGNMNLYLAFGVDRERQAAGLPIWCTEFNQGWWKPYRMGLRGEFMVHVWSAIGKGLRGLFPFAWGPGQWALLNGDDSPAPAAEAMTLFYAQTIALDGILAGLRNPAPDIAFYYARASFYQRDLTNPSHPERLLSTPTNQLRSLYESLSLVGGFPAGLVTDETIAAGDLDRCKVLIVVEGEFVPQSTLTKMKTFVEQGGTLITVGDFARFNEYGFARPAAGVFTAPVKPTTPSVVTVAGRKTWVPPTEDAIRAFTCPRSTPDTKVLGAYADQKPAVVEYPVGKGKVLCIGTSAGVATDASPGETAAFFTTYLENLGIRPSAKTINHFETSRNNLAILGLKDAKSSDWLILANAGNYPANPTIQWSTVKALKDSRAVNVLTGEVLPCTNANGVPQFTIRLDPLEVAFIGTLTTRQ